MECQKIISNVAWTCGCSPKLISTRLLSEDDKQDMLNVNVPIESLITHVKVWMANKMPDYANGKFEPYKPIDEKKKFSVGRHQKMFNSTQK